MESSIYFQGKNGIKKANLSSTNKHGGSPDIAVVNYISDPNNPTQQTTYLYIAWQEGETLTGYYRIYLQKYNFSTDQIVWSNEKLITSNGWSPKITVDDQNNIYIVYEASDASYLKKLDSDGNELWSKKLGSKFINNTTMYLRVKDVNLGPPLSTIQGAPKYINIIGTIRNIVYLQRFDASGNETLVLQKISDTTTDTPVLNNKYDDTTCIAWRSYEDKLFYVQGIDESGNELWSITVDPGLKTGENNVGNPDITDCSSSGFYIGWTTGDKNLVHLAEYTCYGYQCSLSSQDKREEWEIAYALSSKIAIAGKDGGIDVFWLGNDYNIYRQRPSLSSNSTKITTTTFQTSGVVKSTKINIASSNKKIVKARLTADDTIQGNMGLNYLLSADGGAHWEPVSQFGSEHTFAYPGYDLRWKSNLWTNITNNQNTPIINEISISYETEDVQTSSLNISEGPNNPSGDIVAKGSQDIDLLEIKFAANNIEDLKISSLTVFAQKEGVYAVTTDDMYNFALYDGSAQLKSMISPINGYVTFSNISVTIPKSSSKTLMIKGTIKDKTTMNTFRINFDSTPISQTVITGVESGLRPTISGGFGGPFFTFTSASITVTSPNGGEKWQKGSTYNISYSYTGYSNPGFSIKLWKGNQVYEDIVKGTYVKPYNWKVPTDLADGDDYRIEVRLHSCSHPDFCLDPVASDKSDGYFSILTTIEEEPIMPPETCLPDDTLIKLPTDPKIYTIINCKKKWIQTLEEFQQGGYKWEDVEEVASPVIQAYADYLEATANLLRAIGHQKVYRIVNEKRLWVPTISVFNAQGLKWDDIQDVSEIEVNQYPRLKLARVTGDPKVYYLTESGLKRWIPTAEVFNSYNNKWEDVVEIDVTNLNAYPDSILIRLGNGVKVYKIENGKKRWIKAAEAFINLGYDWNNIAPVNETELNYYPVGSDIE